MCGAHAIVAMPNTKYQSNVWSPSHTKYKSTVCVGPMHDQQHCPSLLFPFSSSLWTTWGKNLRTVSDQFLDAIASPSTNPDLKIALRACFQRCWMRTTYWLCVVHTVYTVSTLGRHVGRTHCSHCSLDQSGIVHDQLLEAFTANKAPKSYTTSLPTRNMQHKHKHRYAYIHRIQNTERRIRNTEYRTQNVTCL